MTLATATVIIPTFDHGPLLRHSIASVLAQDHTDFELIVIGDGAPPSTRDILDEIVSQDERVSYQWFDKGERLGETHRNEVLAARKSDFVCYLSDDDLWAPTHLTAMRLALEHADFAHTNHLFVDADSGTHLVAVDLNDEAMRAAHLQGSSFVCLSTLGHTMAAVRDKGLRWHLTPTDRYTDWFFVTGAMNLGLTIASTDSVTMLNIASVFRGGWSLERRLSEIEGWRDVVSTRWDALTATAVLAESRRSRSEQVAHATWCEAARERQRVELDELAARVADLDQRLESTHETLIRSGHEVERMSAEYTRAMTERLHFQSVLDQQVEQQQQTIQAAEVEVAALTAQLAAHVTESAAALAASAAALVGERSRRTEAEERYRVLAATRMARLQRRLARNSIVRRLAGVLR